MTTEDIFLLQKMHANCKAELEATLKINMQLTDEIERLTRPATAVKVIPDNTDLFFKVDSVVFGFKKPAVLHKGQRITPLDVMADESLQHELVRIKSGFIYEKN